MKFRYLGEKQVMTAFGYDFSHGNIPDITDGHVISKLLSNSHFEAVEVIEPIQKPNPEPKKRGRKARGN